MSNSWTYQGWFSGIRRKKNNISLSANSKEETDALKPELNKMNPIKEKIIQVPSNVLEPIVEQIKKINLFEQTDLNNNCIKSKGENQFYKRFDKEKFKEDDQTKVKKMSTSPKLSQFLEKQKSKFSNCCDETEKFCQGEDRTKSVTKNDLSTILKQKKEEWSLLSCNLVDSHCHLELIFNKIKYEKNLNEYFEDYKEFYFKNFEFCINIICDPYKYSNKAYLISSLRNFRNSKVFNTLGCHPHFAYSWSDYIEKLIFDSCSNPLNNIIAIGECGLDLSRKNSVDMEHQIRVFEAQLRIAKKLNLPIVIHCRNTEPEAYDILKKNLDSNHKIHLHCFTGKLEMAFKFLNTFENLCIGVTPLVSYSESVRIVASSIPLNRLLLETDSPYFIPKEFPFMNVSHPAFIYYTAECVAKLRNINLNEVVNSNRENVKKIYSI